NKGAARRSKTARRKKVVRNVAAPQFVTLESSYAVIRLGERYGATDIAPSRSRQMKCIIDTPIDRQSGLHRQPGQHAENSKAIRAFNAGIHSILCLKVGVLT